MSFIQEGDRAIKRRRHRKAKLDKLRAQLAAATTKAEKERLTAKIHRISPLAPLSK